ncbi:MAG: hypothetical protein GZ093_19140, partial [Rhodoferax sp.]|nr:hypothetical protein [Rhodoferax sp.]
ALTVVPKPQASPVEVVEKNSNFKNVALFLAAPFIGLAYAVMLPLVGTAMLAWIGVQALMKKSRAK